MVASACVTMEETSVHAVSFLKGKDEDILGSNQQTDRWSSSLHLISQKSLIKQCSSRKKETEGTICEWEEDIDLSETLLAW